MSRTNFKNFILRKDATGSFEPIKKKSPAPEWFSDWVENKYDVDIHNIKSDITSIKATLTNHGGRLERIENTLVDHGKRIEKLENRP